MQGYEELVETDDPNDVRPLVSAARRQIAVVRRYLAPQRVALETLLRYQKDLFDDEQIHRIREQADRITRYVEDLDLIRERALVVQEELLNRVQQEQNARMYVLSIVAAIFLPITFVTGLFGMNVAGLPGTSNGDAFWLVLIGMGALSALAVWLLKLKKWL